MNRKLLGLSIVLAVVLLAVACASTRHQAVQTDRILSSAIFALQDAEAAAHRQRIIPDDKHRQYLVTIRHLLVAGDDLTVALQHWQPDQPVPTTVRAAVVDVSTLLRDATALVPGAASFLAKIQAVLDVLQKFGAIQEPEAMYGY